MIHLIVFRQCPLIVSFGIVPLSLTENIIFSQVGMSIDPKLLVSNFPVISGTLGLLIAGKTLLVALVGKLFGISTVSAIRVGLLLAPGGEFAFVAFGEAVNQVLLTNNICYLLLHSSHFHRTFFYYEPN